MVLKKLQLEYRLKELEITKQNLARKKLGIPNAKFRSNMGNEENWGGQVRVEVKAEVEVKVEVEVEV